ncbi:Outer membrane protein assembly factor BamB precursor [Methyloligella halotolerans]|uniref:Outer membrane protein assembly factor BamB n=1 Tax=Methyloligella halotolerans TaxID=1177755 RepID=A0A1E2RWD6_9HYPH|nr:PQQ-like beta-propeller repeat protein [Methyloligella halotolerans]ODA66472.1 Outer membrane protein assembly factor BamB precursor [Methyloligella halotolerans]
MTVEGVRSRLVRGGISAFKLALASSFVIGLAGCGASSLNPFEKEETKLPGERIAIIPDQDYKPETSRSVSLPAARANSAWPQPGGSASNSLGHLALAPNLSKRWEVSIGAGSSKHGRLSAVPIVYGDRIYTLDAEGTVSAFSASSGGKIWSATTTPENESGSEGFGGGLAMDSGRLYATTGFGTVVAFDAGSGAIAWTTRTGKPIRSSPTVANGKIFFVSTDSVVHCLSASNGAEVWNQHGLPEPASLLSNASPAVSGNTVVAAFPAGDLGAFQVGNGKPQWTESLSSRSSTTASGMLADPARPVIDQGIVFGVSHGGRMLASSLSSGARRWSKTIASTQMPWPAGDAVFVVDVHGKLLALSRSDGAIRWVSELPKSSHWSGPVLAGGRLWLVSSEGLLVGADARTGQVATEINLEQTVLIAPIVVSGRMYILTDEAELIALG